MPVAAIDIGSNTILLLISEIEQGKLHVLDEQQRIPRLGHGVDRQGRLDDERMRMGLSILSEYRQHVVDRYGKDVPIYVTATSAVRDASNRDEFVEMIRRRTGLEVELLSGVEEARRTYSGAVGMLPEDEEQANLVVDIGGGSSEVAAGTGRSLENRHSFDMGSVRFTERYLVGNPPEQEEVDACRRAVREMLDEAPFAVDEQSRLVGVAGTVTSLVYMQRDLKAYSSEAVNGYVLNLRVLRNWIKCFTTQPHEEMLHRYPEVMQGRSDVFPAGLLILEGVMRHFGRERLIVSTGGIRHGTILQHEAKE